MRDKITLTPVAMIRPNKDFIYAPSRFRESLELTPEEFANYNSKKIKVSFDDDGISNPVEITAYGLGLSAWYI